MVAAAATLPAVSRMAAQTYPARPVRWIIGFPPGGGADTVARIMGPWLSERLGQQVIIENRPGASSNIAVQAVINSPPDGYTLLFLGASAVVNTILFENLPFNLHRDIAPVSGLIDYPMVMVAHPSVPAKTIAEIIAHAKANPGKVTMASFGTGSASHLAGELFKMMAGIDMVHVPYRGGAPMITDLVGGQVQVGFDVMVTSLPHIRTGALRALGVAGSKRFSCCRTCRLSPRQFQDMRQGHGPELACQGVRRRRLSLASTARLTQGWRNRPSVRGSSKSAPSR